MVGGMEETLTTHLLALADAYVAATGTSIATVSERAGGDWKFFEKLRDRSLNYRVKTYDRAVEWFASNWPDGVEMPSRAEPEAV